MIMAKLPGSGIRMASIPLAQTVQPFSPEAGSPTDPGPGPGPGPRPSGGWAGAAGLIGLLLLGLGLGGSLLTAPSDDEQTVVPPAANTVTAAGPTLGPLEVAPAMRVYLMPY